jgi:hypothetical protein
MKPGVPPECSQIEFFSVQRIEIRELPKEGRIIERAKWCPWRGRWQRCLVKLVITYRWSAAKGIRDGERKTPGLATRTVDDWAGPVGEVLS